VKPAWPQRRIMLACMTLSPLGPLWLLAPAQAGSGPETSKEKSMESAKRRAPSFKPLVHKGVRYEPLRRATEQGFSQSGGVLAATEVVSGKQLWAVQLYRTAFDANEERDAQEVYISTLAIEPKTGALLVTDERKRRWRVQLADGKVEAVQPRSR